MLDTGVLSGLGANASSSSRTSAVFPEGGASSAGSRNIETTHNSEAASQPTVCGLRDRLLREAKTERQRCLEVAEAAERRRADAWSMGLDPEAASPSASRRAPASPSGPLEAPGPQRRAPDALAATSPLPRPSALGALDVTGRAAPSLRERDEDEAQMEAIRTLHQLGERSNQATTQFSVTEARMAEVSGQLDYERRQRQKAEAALAHERKSREAKEQQVLCLEVELDNREAALQVAERTLEHRNADLQEALVRLRALQDGYGFFPPADSAAESRLRSQLIEAEQQLELKDSQISRLLDVLRTRGVFLEDESTACGSERSMVSTATLRSEIRA